jgi:hypothetical protein
VFSLERGHGHGHRHRHEHPLGPLSLQTIDVFPSGSFGTQSLPFSSQSKMSIIDFSGYFALLI